MTLNDFLYRLEYLSDRYGHTCQININTKLITVGPFSYNYTSFNHEEGIAHAEMFLREALLEKKLGTKNE